MCTVLLPPGEADATQRYAMYAMYALYAMFATFATPSGHTDCDSYETAEKKLTDFFLSSLVQDVGG